MSPFYAAALVSDCLSLSMRHVRVDSDLDIRYDAKMSQSRVPGNRHLTRG